MAFDAGISRLLSDEVVCEDLRADATRTKIGGMTMKLAMVGAVVVVVAGGAGAALFLRDSHELRTTKEILSQRLTAPSTTRYVEFKVVSEYAGWRQVHVVVDSQNALGAIMRSSLCLVFRYSADGKSHWYRDYVMRECSYQPTPEELGQMAKLNGWGDPEKP